MTVFTVSIFLLYFNTPTTKCCKHLNWWWGANS